jgi:iron complex outermembrane receptor protein
MLFGRLAMLAAFAAWPLSCAEAQQNPAGETRTALPVLAADPNAMTIVVSPQSGSLTAPSVAAQRRAINRTVGSVGFIDAESYKNTYANNLRDVLQDAPGIYVQNRYSQELRLSVRGSGIGRSYHTRGLEILQDGIPTNLADGSGDYYQIDPLGLRAVEIYKGGNALTFGGSTLGGAINFVTPTARNAASPNSARIEGGSFGTGRVNAQVSRVLGDWDIFFNGTLTHADGWRQHETQKSAQFNGNIGYRISPNVETRFYIGSYTVNQKLPGTLNLQDALHAPRKASAAALSGDQARDTQTFRIANRTTFRFDSGRLDVDSWYIQKSLYHPIFQVIDQSGATYGIAPRYSQTLDLGGFRNDLVIGARAYGGDNKAQQFLNIAGNRGAPTLNSRQNAANYEVFAENRFFVLPDVALMAGVKALRSERDYTDRGGIPGYSPTPKSQSKSYATVNPKFGILWEPHGDIQVFADITRSSDVPDFTDLNQTIGATNRFVPLSLQHAWTAEVGTRGRYGRFSWDVTAYRALVRDELLQYTTNPSIPAATFNAGRTIHQGLEIGGSVELVSDVSGAGDTLSLSQLYNFNDFRFDGDPQYGNNRIAGVPLHVLRTALTYKHPIGFYLTPIVDWIPQGAYVDFANTKRAPAYTLFGLQTGMEWKNGLSLFIDMRNLANKRYVSDFATVTRYTPAYASFYPGTGRSIYAGLRYRW